MELAAAERHPGWRGSATGIGEVANDTMQPGDPDLIQRVRLCLAARAIPGVDVKLFALPEHFDLASGTFERLQLEGIVGSFVPPDETARGKFWFDVDGSTNAWSNLYTLLMGCCVIKVASEHGFRQWYYGDLVPWTHFVPIAADLSNLGSIADWCRSNDD